MPGYRPGVFRKRHHYRPSRRVVVRRVAAVVAEECRLELVMTARADFELVCEEPDDQDTTNGRTPFALTLVYCREDV